MDELSFQDKPSKAFQFRFHPFVLAFFFCGLFFLAIGGGLFLFSREKEPDVEIISGDTLGANVSDSEVMVHVDGAVLKPGVYKLKADLRVNGAIEAAGGMTADADSTKVNLAAKIADGMKVVVPSKSSTNVSNSTIVASYTGLVSINSADSAQLDKLPGVGPVTAQKIIDSRPYSTIDELVSKKVVSQSVFEKIKLQISL